MKPNTDTTLRTEGTLGGKRKAMTIDANSLDRMTLMLTDLYSDKEGSVIREYPINGLDSHRAAGTTRPIEVTLPTATDPTFVVKDYGTGLSEYDVMEHFSQYGWSSKLETNEEVGMMGLGCKAALTYTKQFALTAIKDGLATEVLVLRAIDKETGREVPSVESVSVTPTDEPNGVTVYIPVDHILSFNRKAKHFFSHWKPGDVLVDGEEPAPIPGRWLDDDILIQDGRDRMIESGTTIVMGNIPYPVSYEHDLARRLFARSHVIIWVPIGSVDPTPPREALSYTPRTLETLKEARTFIKDRLQRNSQVQLDACATHAEAVKLHMDLRHRVAWHMDLTYRGRRFPTNLRCPIDYWEYAPHIDRAYRAEAPVYKDLEAAVARTYIVGHATKTVSRKQRDKILGYLHSLDGEGPGRGKLGHRLTIIHDLDWSNGWLEGTRTIQWSEIEAVEVAKRAQQPQEERTYQTLKPNSWSTNGPSLKEKDLPQDMRLVYVSPRVQSDDNYRFFRTAMHQSHFTVVLLHPRSFMRFKRTFPKALSAKQAVYQELRRATQELPNALFDEIQSLLGHHCLRNLEKMGSEDRPKVEDKKLRDLLEIVRSVRGHDQHQLRLLQRAAEELEISYWHLRKSKKQQFDLLALTEVVTPYPLLQLPGGDAPDLIDYVNAMHSRRKDHP